MAQFDKSVPRTAVSHAVAATLVALALSGAFAPAISAPASPTALSGDWCVYFGDRFVQRIRRTHLGGDWFSEEIYVYNGAVNNKGNGHSFEETIEELNPQQFKITVGKIETLLRLIDPDTYEQTQQLNNGRIIDFTKIPTEERFRYRCDEIGRKLRSAVVS